MDSSSFENISGLVHAAVITHHKISMEQKGIPLSYENIKEVTDDLLKMFQSSFPDISDLDRKRLLKSVTDTYDATIGEKMVAVTNRDAPRWLDAKKHEISWDHWNAYKKMLQQQGRSKVIIDANEEVIDTILDFSGDPRQDGSWARKGLVMGNVQSGKTQNYLGLINKAIDAGYQTIIVLGGHLNDLRMQTQERIDEGVLGAPSRHHQETSAGQVGPIGVGLWYKNKIVAATTTAGDFSAPFADSFGVKLDAGTTVIFTIKKQTQVMKALIAWIERVHFLNSAEGKTLAKPMLLIDDEADYASINTKSHKNEVTLTNELIRQLLSQFSKSSYVAYTATPFANVFIDPDEKSYNELDDLFPSDFMIKMSVPKNYLGQDFFFGEDALQNESNATSPIIEVKDHWPVHELKSNSGTDYELPESLKDAIRAFIIVTAVRAIRGEEDSHNTMLVNISHLSKHQNALEALIADYKTELYDAISAFGSMASAQAEKNKVLSSLEKTYKNKFDIEESYESIIGILSSNRRRNVYVWAINQSGKKKDRHELNYSTYKEFGLSVIVIGGHKLSRGLTLEGLSISYFARNSKAYDTLMQMCRWFGYRPSYKDLCKVYLPEESISWYAFISSTIKELYSELELMAEREERPKDFGLKVREHPGAMLITAKNKVGWSRSHTLSQELWGQTHRRYKFQSDTVPNANNVAYAKLFLEGLLGIPDVELTEHPKSGSLLISNVSYKDIIDFINAIELPEDDLGDNALVHQLQEMESAGITRPKVLLFNQSSSVETLWSRDLSKVDEEFLAAPYNVAGRKVTLPRRSMNLLNGMYRVRSVHLGNPNDERLFLSQEHQDIVKNSISSRPVDHDYLASKHRDFAGLKISFFGISERRAEGDRKAPKLIHGHEATLGYTLSFPRSDTLKGLSPQQVKALLKSTRHSYAINKVHDRNKELVAYEDIDFD